jgi:branched-chain amino acid transport system permease protein
MGAIFLQQVLNGVIIGSVYCLIAVGLTMIFGVMKISNFAHGDLAMLGAYVGIYATAVLSGWFGWVGSLVLAAMAVGLLGSVVERLMFRPLMKRRSELDVIMLSIGLFILLENGAKLAFSATPRMIADPFDGRIVHLGPFSTSAIRLATLLFAVLSILVLQVFLNRARVGIAIRATSQNSNAARLMGVNIDAVYTLTFVIGSALAGVGGVLYGTIFAVFPLMGALPTLKAFAIIIMGGMGSIRGAIVAGLILGVSETLGGAYVSMDYKNAIGFLIVITVLLVIPQGLFGTKQEGALVARAQP